MEKLSVKKPFTVLVAVIIIVALGFVSLSKMSAELLPDMNIPYVIVVVPYPGASPEKVELEVSAPMEAALGTVKNIKNVYSVSNENYAMVQLEFADGTNMDSAMVNISSAVNQASAALPASAGTPSILQLSMDMIANLYVAVSRDNTDIYELSDYVKSEVVPQFQRQNGVASVSTVGLVEKYVQVDLNKEKIDELNNKILAEANSAMAKAKRQLDYAKEKVNEGRTLLTEQQAKFGDTLSSAIFGQLDQPSKDAAKQIKELAENMTKALERLQEVIDTLQNGGEEAAALRKEYTDKLNKLREESSRLNSETIKNYMDALATLMSMPADLSELISKISEQVTEPMTDERINEALDALSQLSEWTENGLPTLMNTLEKSLALLSQSQLDATLGFSEAARQLANSEAQLNTAYEQFNNAKQQALSSANVDKLVSPSTLSQLIYAQNFSMPAGYVDDENDQSWLLKVGDEYASAEGISEALLADIDGIGTIRISDVADVCVLDNTGDSYASLNGQDGIMLCIYKSSTAGTNEVSRNCRKAIDELLKEDESLHLVRLVDQGKYIDIIVDSIKNSMILGAVLAIIVLVFFLKDVRPTLIVALSIPLSVILAILLMYFTGFSLNMMTLCGLALGIGMLVDNSIVVLENIMRLRARGVSPARAGVQGTKQMVGPIAASTLTTVCVFLPMVFTTGTVRSLLIPLAMSVTYCLFASLLVAMTVIPAATSTLLKNIETKENKFITKIRKAYSKRLRWCLTHKTVPLVLATLLFAVCVIKTISMGIVILPEMTTDSIEVGIYTPDGDTREESYAKVDQVMQALLTIDGIDDIGIMDSGSVTSSVGVAGGSMGSSYNGAFTCFVVIPDDYGKEKVMALCSQIGEATKDIDAVVEASSGSMTDFTAFVSSGLSVKVFGKKTDKIIEIANRVADAAKSIEGFTDVSTGMEDSMQTLHLVIDKDKAMQYGLTVAQIYMAIADRLNTDIESTTISVSGSDMNVKVRNLTNTLTRENLLDIEFTEQGLGSMGSNQASSTAAVFGSVTNSGSAGNEGNVHKLSEFAYIEETLSTASVRRENLSRYMTVTASVAEGYNTTLLSRQLNPLLKEINESLPMGYAIELSGEASQVSDMMREMGGLIALGLLFIYLVMVAQFQSLLSPFIILFTVPLAFTGGLIGLLIAGQKISMMAIMGFVILMGTVVNNGIVFVDYTNQLRLGGMKKHDALVATAETRMRPILMTALTTILAMAVLIFGRDMASQMAKGLAIVIVGGLLYATLMTLFIIPLMYDLLFRKEPQIIDTGSDIDDEPDDAAEFLEALKIEQETDAAEKEEQSQKRT